MIAPPLDRTRPRCRTNIITTNIISTTQHPHITQPRILGDTICMENVHIINTRISRRVTIVTQCHNCDALCHNCDILFVKMLELGSEIIPNQLEKLEAAKAA